ncbi:diguanylate cyclase [Telmatobacter bradus]|uniref:ligand-binding sensor domain-containing diguanylate cyclase n=1 Tax=Telmatobacter bradus TaxID=474953 RepID=UPI003B43B307
MLRRERGRLCPYTFSLSLLFFLCLVVVPAVHAQYITLQHFSEDQGLDNLAIVNAAKDSQGMLWVATNGGLFRYDGLRFHFVGAESGVPEGDVAPLFVSSNGTIWAGYRQGLFYSNGKEFHKVRGIPLHLGFGGSTQLHEGQNGELIVLVSGKLVSVTRQQSADGEDWVASDYATLHSGFPHLQSIHSARSTAEGLWLGCDQALCRWSDGKMQTWGVAEGVPADEYISIRQLRNGEVWVRSQSHLLRLEPGGRWKDVASEIALPSLQTRFCPLAEDPEGHLLATVGDTLLLHDARGWTIFNSAHGMPENDLSSLFVDHNESIWIGTQGGGLLRWKGYGRWESFTLHEGLPSNSVWQIASGANGSLIAATSAGLALKPQGQQEWRPMPGIPRRCAIYAVQRTEDGAVWYACENAFYRYEEGTGKTQNYALPDMAANILVLNNTVWVSTLKGLFHVDLHARDRSLHRVDELGDQRIGQLAAGLHNDLWISARKGIYHMDPAPGGLHLVIPASMKMNGFPLIVDKQGNLWFGSMGEGVNRALLQGEQLLGIDSFVRPVVHSRQFYSMMMDRRGWIWCGGDAGMDVYHDGAWGFLNSNNGLIVNDPNEGSLLEDRDGSIWIGTSGGLSHLFHPATALRIEPGTIRILSVRLNGKDLPITPLVTVPAGTGMLEVKVGASEHEEMPGVQLMYRSPGSMENWTPLGESTLRISQGTPRKLQLQFQLMQQDGTEVSPMVEMTVVVLPAWWRSSIALTLYALAGLAMLYTAWYMRTHKMRIMQRRLKELVAIRTAELMEKNRALEAARKELEYKASHDPLTGLLNRGALLELLVREMDRCERKNSSLVVVILDLDYFKRVNDTYGHAVGDAVLVEVSFRLRSALRPYDAIGRYGGEEFVLVLPELDESTALNRLDALRTVIAAQPVLSAGNIVQVTASFGYTLFKPHDHAASLLQRADAALYLAKAAGRNRVRFIGELKDPSELNDDPVI